METVYLWKHIGGWIRLLKIRGRWYYLGDGWADLESWLVRHSDVRIVRQGGERVVARAYDKHGATLGTLRKSFPPVSESPLP